MAYYLSDTDPTYLTIPSFDPPVASEEAAKEWIALCWEHDTTRLLVYDVALGADFFTLKTGVAGAILQKMVNYGIRFALVTGDTPRGTSHFREMEREANDGPHFRLFRDVASAEAWLLS
ncbi:MAG: DUF4180 domain-containing protein [Clostridiaceae bacterium]|nr:DUF4180 domain-containing protein [Clostridiaceae bacterium]